MNLSKIHHIAIIVSNYESAKDFYVNKLGFSIIRENYRSEVKELAEVGIECEPIRVDDFTGKKMTFFHDPDGLPLELHE